MELTFLSFPLTQRMTEAWSPLGLHEAASLGNHLTRRLTSKDSTSPRSDCCPDSPMKKTETHKIPVLLTCPSLLG